MPNPTLTVQTGTLYASGEDSTFTGTGGPWGFSPFTSEFGGVVSSAGLAAEPVDDALFGVATGDEVIFVVALQNMTAGQRAFDVRVKSTLPPGFAAPVDGTNLTVTNGLGTDLAFSGDLFGAGLLLSAPVAGYDATSGANVVLVTYTLAAAANLPGPNASIVSTATIPQAAASAGGLNVIGASPPSAGTVVVTAEPAPLVEPETSAAAVASGQTIAFDVTIPLPTGTWRDLQVSTELPDGASTLSLVSANVTRMGAGLQSASPVVGQDGTVRFGTVVNSGSGGPGGGTIGLRLVLRANGTASGTALLQTVVSAAGADAGAPRWTATVGNSVGVVVPPTPPSIAGLGAVQRITASTAVHPFGTVVLAGDAARTGTLAVIVQDNALGRLSGGHGGSLNAAGGTFVMSGSFAALQQAARQLVFTPATTGTERFTLTLVDSAGGVAQDGTTAVTIGSSTAAVSIDPGQTLWVGELSGSYVFNGTGSTLRADRASSSATVSGFRTGDTVVLPGSVGTTLRFVDGGRGRSTLSIGAFSLILNGDFSPSVFAASTDSNGMTVVSIRSDPLFDAAYYLARNPDVAATGMDPFLHFMYYGWKESRSPSAFFDVRYYLAKNPDVAAAGINPLAHFEAYGWREGRDPSLAFSLSRYTTTYALPSSVNPLVDYMTGGAQAGRVARSVLTVDPLVDGAYYSARNAGVPAAAAEAADAYHTTGWRQHTNPSAFFDTNFYLSRNADVAQSGIDPLQHFALFGWREGRDPSLLFSISKYLTAYRDVAAAGMNPLTHYLNYGRYEGRQAPLTGGTAQADILIDADFYNGQLGATLLPTGTAAANQAAWSYHESGWLQGLNPDAWFDTRYYLSHNLDVLQAHIDPLMHYERYGWREHRMPSPAFNGDRYLQTYRDVAAAGLNPLQHYVEYGRFEGRAAFPA